MRFSAVLAISLAWGCAPDEAAWVEEAALGVQQSPIVGGTVAMGDPAVVAVSVGSNQYCTGTLVAPRTVLTAAHCVYSYGQNAPYYVLFGTYSSNPTKRVRVIAQHRHPNYDQRTRDLGLLRLESAVTDVLPLEMNNTPISAADVGRPIRHVGFGTTSGAGGGGGTKREVTYPLRQFDTWLLESAGNGQQTCGGDSGGPGLMVTGGNPAERVVGVVSWGDQGCNQIGIDARVDTDLQWIRTTMAGWEAPSCENDGQCVPHCAQVDQDCVCMADGACNPQCTDVLRDPDCPRDCVKNGVCSTQACPEPDPDCVQLGGICTSELSCVTRQCVSDAQSNGFYCTAGCATSAECPAGMECSAAKLCQFRQRPEKELGSLCTAEDYCRNRGICTGPRNEALRCALPCGNVTDCPVGYTCEGGVDGRSFCRSPQALLAPKELALAPGEFAAHQGCASTGGAPVLLCAGGLLGLGIRRRRRCEN